MKANQMPVTRIAYAIVILFIFFSQSSVLFAQETEIDKSEVPEAVLQAIESDYMSCSGEITWYIHSGSDNINYYVVNATGDKITCEAYYDRNGNLIHSKTVMKDAKLPIPILEAVYEIYPEWTITEDHVVIRDFDENKMYSEVEITKGRESKTLYFDSNGEELTPGLVFGPGKEMVSANAIPNPVTERVQSDYMSCRENITWYSYTERPGMRPDYYVATATGDGIRCESRYDRNGNLVSSKTVATNVKLPSAITRFIARDYPGWTITGDQRITTDFDETTTYYTVVIRSESGERQTLYFDRNGNKIDPANV
ncbi:PepSY-like domain-containing protein [Rhodohalobacter mucosus]|uniref:Putative beta-lactamase-inhibitor-like PepSY-like domain-containing protein n=1 Tax=Rhodohalobacter mucosus TaxID=2079485 RepID=A0A316TW50_9BACT|nr:PepSY-like domain-containing protein [Rhodohalobacter mucosus]PWN07415.1 hypothetical protein DDZ15_03895 [Rhodohalobacter mucosus]